VRRQLLLRFAVGALVFTTTHAATGHGVTVDGVATEWMLRLPPADNLAIVARDTTPAGELIWLDNLGDTRTDIAMPETVADITAVQVTGTANELGILVRLASGAAAPGPVQVQVAIDVDRVSGSGQNFFASFADTQVHNDARWEYLATTQLGSGGTGIVLDSAFAQVAEIVSAQGTDGVEMSLPWTALGLAGPPTSALRLTIATFRSQVDDLTIPIGDGTVSNALDAVTHYGDPASTGYPNTFVEVSDQVVDHYLDVHFDANGEVYSPLLVTHFVSSSSAVTSSGEWFIVRNVSPNPITLSAFKVGDAALPDAAGEGMLSFPAGAVVATQSNYAVAASAAAYLTAFGSSPDAEVSGTDPAVADLSAFGLWGGAALGLDDAGDELVLLDASNTIVDVVTYGAGSFAGVTPIAMAPLTDIIALRTPLDSDTDDCSVDFVLEGIACFDDITCGGDCDGCSETHVCRPLLAGAACADADLCNGDETCDGGGNCVVGSPLDCALTSDCQVGSCEMLAGCVLADVASGTPCDDLDPANGPDTCDGMGSCVPEGGVGGAGGSGAVGGAAASGGASTGASGGTGANPPNNNLGNDQEQIGISDEGCGCRTGPATPVRSTPLHLAWLLAGPLGLLLRRRRRSAPTLPRTTPPRAT